MTRVVTGLAVSVDGYIAGPDDGPGQPLGSGGERLFDWYFAGGEVTSRFYPQFRMSSESAAVFDAAAAATGAVVSGRRTYEIAHAWGGKGPLPGVPLLVLTHEPPSDQPPADPPYTFVTTGIVDAIEAARAVASRTDRDVALMGSAPVRQALENGLLDELTLHVVPVLLGAGVRLLDGSAARLRLLSVVDAPGVTHLTYEVLR